MSVTNQDVITFSNENVRRMADWVVTLYNFSQGAQTQMTQLAAAGLVTGAGQIMDGAGTGGDSRQPITADQILTFLSHLNTIFNNAPLIASLQAVSVNNWSPDYSDLSWNEGA